MCLGTRCTVSRCERTALDFYFLQLDGPLAEDRDLFFWTSRIAPFHTRGVLDGKKSNAQGGK